MNLGFIFAVMPKLMPLMPRAQKAMETLQRLEADPDVKDAIAVAHEIATVLAAEQAWKEQHPNG